MTNWRPREIPGSKFWTRVFESFRTNAPGPLSSAYRDATNARLDDIERRLSEIERLVRVLSLGPDVRK
jgi:hypothetical protein